jgi:glycosyltransferase involved in cell wall biosynthesis
MIKRKVAILGSRGIPARYGGFETFAEQLATRLVEAGHQVSVYCEASATEQASEYRGVKLEFVPSRSVGAFTTILFDLRCLLKAMRGFDVVYMLGYGAALFCFLPRLTGAQVWINMDGVEWRRSKWSRLAKSWLWAMENVARFSANRLIADADGIVEHLSSRYRLLPPVTTIAYGAERVESAPPADFLDGLDVHPDDYYLVVCRLEPENHVLEIVEGFLHSATDKILLIVGDHRSEQAYVKQLLQHVSDRVRFLGTVYDQLALQALRFHCYAYFHGHSVGGTNPSLLEALGCGNPVLAHDNVFNREVAGNAGRYFSDARQIPALVQSLEHDPGLREQLRHNAYRRIREAYTWERVVGDYLALLNDSQSST